MSDSQGKIKVTRASQEATGLFENWEADKWPPVLTPVQAAELLGYSVKTLYEWHRLGRLKGCCRKRGKHIRFLRDRLIQTFFYGKDWK